MQSYDAAKVLYHSLPAYSNKDQQKDKCDITLYDSKPDVQLYPNHT